jgi:2-haloacid dehalogenase
VRDVFTRVFVDATADVTMSAVSSQPAAHKRQGAVVGRERIIVVDVNETMLDIEALEPHFLRAFGSGQVLREWFSTVLLYSNVATLAGPYSEFGAIAGAALEMIASARSVVLTPHDRDSILNGMRTLPAHAGFRLVTLTNSVPVVVEQQLWNAGLNDLFERSFSVDAVRRFKPAPDAYRHVAREMGVTVGQLRMVAAHAWDVVGALQAGCAAAFVARPGKVLYPLAPSPDVVAPDVVAVADAIIAAESRR